MAHDESRRLERNHQDSIRRDQATVSSPGVSGLQASALAIAQRAAINPYSLAPADVMQLQKTLGNEAVSRLLEAPGAQAGTIQRQVFVGGQDIGNALDYLKANDHAWLLTSEQEFIADFMSVHPDKFRVSDPESLVLEIERADATLRLIRSVLRDGLLSRGKLTQMGKDYEGSLDTGNTTELAVNILDVRRTEGSNLYNDALRIAKESLSAENRGSFSVAMERQDDPIREELLAREDVHLNETEELELALQALNTGEDKEFLKLAARWDKTALHNKTVLRSFIDELNERVQRTILAIIPQPDKSVARQEAGVQSYESDAPSGIIPAGSGGFTELLVPQWFQPFERLVEVPSGITIKFVGNRTVTAKFKGKGQHTDVTVNAPDYAGEVAAQLAEYKLLATHIMKA